MPLGVVSLKARTLDSALPTAAARAPRLRLTSWRADPPVRAYRLPCRAAREDSPLSRGLPLLRGPRSRPQDARCSLRTSRVAHCRIQARRGACVVLAAPWPACPSHFRRTRSSRWLSQRPSVTGLPLLGSLMTRPLDLWLALRDQPACATPGVTHLPGGRRRVSSPPRVPGQLPDARESYPSAGPRPAVPLRHPPGLRVAARSLLAHLRAAAGGFRSLPLLHERPARARPALQTASWPPRAFPLLRPAPWLRPDRGTPERARGSGILYPCRRVLQRPPFLSSATGLRAQPPVAGCVPVGRRPFPDGDSPRHGASYRRRVPQPLPARAGTQPPHQRLWRLRRPGAGCCGVPVLPLQRRRVRPQDGHGSH